MKVVFALFNVLFCILIYVSNGTADEYENCEIGQTCKGPIGKIISPIDAVKNKIYTITPTSSSRQNVYYILYAKDIFISSKDCKLEFLENNQKDEEIDGNSDVTLIYKTSSKIRATTSGKPDCRWEFWYFTYDITTDKTKEELTSTEGTITSPEAPDPILQNLFGYKFNTHAFWLINIPNPRAFININITQLDLGSLNPVMHYSSNTQRMFQRDYLLIGSGPMVFNGTDKLFFGKAESEILLTVPSNIAHIFFISDAHHENAKGFEIQYEAKIDETPTTTMAPETTTRVYVPASAWAPVNGLSSSEVTVEIESQIRSLIASLAMEFGQNNNIEFKEPIQAEDVYIIERKSCSPDFCRRECVAFKFEVEAKTLNDEWAFTDEDLNDLLKINPNRWNSIGEEVTICEEHPTLNFNLIIGFICGSVVFMIAIGLMVMKVSKMEDVNRKELEKDKRDEEEEDVNRKKSILSIDSRKNSMPFPKDKTKILTEGFQLQDVRNYVEYDPHNNLQNLHILGIEKELHNNRVLSKEGSYVNSGFIDEEDSPAVEIESQNSKFGIKQREIERKRNPSYLANSDSDIEEVVRSANLKEEEEDDSSEGETSF